MLHATCRMKAFNWINASQRKKWALMFLQSIYGNKLEWKYNRKKGISHENYIKKESNTFRGVQCAIDSQRNHTSYQLISINFDIFRLILYRNVVAEVHKWSENSMSKCRYNFQFRMPALWFPYMKHKHCAWLCVQIKINQSLIKPCIFHINSAKLQNYTLETP